MQASNLVKTIENLENHSITPYEMIDFLRAKQTTSDMEVIRLYNNHKSDYVRLCLAWYMGETREEVFFTPLAKSYDTEKDDNVRANIVWSLFAIDSRKVDNSFFAKFLQDSYFLVPLIAVKRLNKVKFTYGDVKFGQLYSNYDNTLIKCEILRKITYFSTTEKDLEILKNELYSTNDFVLKMELIKSIGELNKENTTQFLLQYFEKDKINILKNESLAYKYVEAVQATMQSSPCHNLHEIYSHFSGQLLRMKVIETLTIAGGPECLNKLKAILLKEDDEELVNILKKSIQLITVTIK